VVAVPWLTWRLNTLPVTSVLDCDVLSPDQEPLCTAARIVTLCGAGNT